jgi:hypothetical protein
MSHQYRDWRDYLIRCLDDTMPREELYHLLNSNSLVGLFTCIFIRARLRDRIRGVSGAEIKRGMGGRAGNKVGHRLQCNLHLLTGSSGGIDHPIYGGRYIFVLY